MVRIITGTLLDVSDQNLNPMVVGEILEFKDRKRAGITAPAHALYLHEIIY